jgi:MFS transporter, PPP family, 3-phenylpropionic acid transporter
MPARIFSLRFSFFYAFLMIGSGLSLPFFPLWLHAKGLTVGQIAEIVAGMTACRVLAVPLAAMIADKYRNRRTVIIACGIATFFAYVLLATASSFGAILLCSLVVSLCFAPVFPLAEGFSVDGSVAHKLDYGRMRLWASISFLAGSVGGGALLQFMPIGTLIYLIVAAQGLSGLTAFFLPIDPDRETLKHEAVSASSLSSLYRLLISGSFGIFLIAVSLAQGSHGMLYSFGPVRWDALGFDKFTIGSFWAISIMAEVTLFGFSNHLVRCIGAINLIVIGIAVGVVRWALMAYDLPLGVNVLTQLLHAITFAMLHLGTMHYIRQTVPPGLRNSAQGLYAAFSGGIVMTAAIGISGVFYSSLLGKTYLIMAAMSLVALSFALALKRTSPKALAAADTSDFRQT